MNYSLAIHIVGIVMWLGGLLVLCRLMTVNAAKDGALGENDVLHKIYSTYVLHGSGIVLLTGIFQLFYRGIPYYFSQGWFHGKLTLVVLLVVATALQGLELSKLKRGESVQVGKVRAVQIIGIISLISIPFLTLLGRS